ncbi:MAG: glutaminase [Moritella sp.]|jgi:glutaminase
MLSNASLEQLLAEVRPLMGQGHVADYIPALANVDANQLGIAVCMENGDFFTAGDTDIRFSIQSISKVFALTAALTRFSEDELWSRVGREPSGQAYNSLIQLEYEKGKPRNPFINAGALVVADMLQSRLSAPKQRMLELLRKLANSTEIYIDYEVAESEYEHMARNAAIAYLMKSHGNFHNNVDTVLQSYFSYCAIKMNCVELATAFSFLAKRGQPCHCSKRLVSERNTRRLNALLATCGLYDESGDFAFRVGMPAKSGVGGGIVAVIPGQLTVCVWSPELNESGNSLVGTAALELFSERFGHSIF